MSEIPSDVMLEAENIWAEAWAERWREDGKNPKPALYIARAIMEERERCAILAHDYGLDAERGSEYRLACDDITEGIRGTSQPL